MVLAEDVEREAGASGARRLRVCDDQSDLCERRRGGDQVRRGCRLFSGLDRSAGSHGAIKPRLEYERRKDVGIEDSRSGAAGVCGFAEVDYWPGLGRILVVSDLDLMRRASQDAENLHGLS